LSKSELLLL